MKEEISLLFPFVVEDVCPSLFSSEFIYASVEKCNLYSVAKESLTCSIHLTDQEVYSTNSLSIQPSSHPLIYYMSHPNGLYAVDFRQSKPTTILSKQNCCGLQRIEGDWNHYILANDHEIGIFDLRNPVLYDQCWRYTGTLKTMDCYQTKDSNGVDFHILSNVDSVLLNYTVNREYPTTNTCGTLGIFLSSIVFGFDKRYSHTHHSFVE